MEIMNSYQTCNLRALTEFLKLVSALKRTTKAPFVNFSVSKILDLEELPVNSFIFDKYHRSWAAATPVKYKCDIH